jgi:hypothetical protein
VSLTLQKLRGWLAVEHYRLHVMELWPDGPRKVTGLVAARSALDRLARALPTGSPFACSTCANGRPPFRRCVPVESLKLSGLAAAV